MSKVQRKEYDDEWGSNKLPRETGTRKRFSKKELFDYVEELEENDDSIYSGQRAES
jgi:hypothetical protein